MGSAAQKGRSGALADTAKSEGWNIVTEQTAEWNAEKAQQIVQSVIDSGQAFNVIYAENDDMAKGAVAALDKANISHGVGKDVIVMGFDCNKWALEELLNQNWNYDGQCNPFQASYIADVIQKLQNNEEITEKTIIMDEKGFDATTITEDDVNKYGEKLNNELRQNETENKPSVSPVTNAADNRETAAPAVTEENIVAAAEINMENIIEITVRPETQTENTNTQADTALPETVAEEFKNNMISGHQRLQEVRAKIAARKNSTEDNPQTAADDIALIRSLRTRPARQTVIRRPQNFSAERMMLLQAMQRC